MGKERIEWTGLAQGSPECFSIGPTLPQNTSTDDQQRTMEVCSRREPGGWYSHNGSIHEPDLGSFAASRLLHLSHRMHPPSSARTSTLDSPPLPFAPPLWLSYLCQGLESDLTTFPSQSTQSEHLAQTPVADRSSAYFEDHRSKPFLAKRSSSPEPISPTTTEQASRYACIFSLHYMPSSQIIITCDYGGNATLHFLPSFLNTTYFGDLDRSAFTLDN